MGVGHGTLAIHHIHFCIHIPALKFSLILTPHTTGRAIPETSPAPTQGCPSFCAVAKP